MWNRATISGTVAALVLTGCVVGSGELATSDRSVSGFDQIRLLTSGDVYVEAGEPSLVIEGDENVLPLLTSEVEGGVLVLGSDGSFSTSRGITYRVTTNELVGVELAGSGDIETDMVDASTFVAAISGSGSVRPSGRCGTLGVDISGSGTFDGSELACSIGRVEIAGSGDALVQISDALEATVTGSGSIEYLGDPEVSSTVTGSGSIERGAGSTERG